MAGEAVGGRRSAARHAVAEDFGRWTPEDRERQHEPGAWDSTSLHDGRLLDDRTLDRMPQRRPADEWAPDGWGAETADPRYLQDRGPEGWAMPDLPVDDRASHDLPTGKWSTQDRSPAGGAADTGAPAGPTDRAPEEWVVDDRYSDDSFRDDSYRDDSFRGDSFRDAPFPDAPFPGERVSHRDRRDDRLPADAMREPAAGPIDPGSDGRPDAGVPEAIQVVLDEYSARRRAAEDVAATAESIAAAAAERAAAAIAAAARAAEEAEAAADAAARAAEDAEAAAEAEQRAIAAAAGGRAAPFPDGDAMRRGADGSDGGPAQFPGPPGPASAHGAPTETRLAAVRSAAPPSAGGGTAEPEHDAPPEHPGAQGGRPDGPGPGGSHGARRGPEATGPAQAIRRPAPFAGPPPPVAPPRGWLPQEATAVIGAVPGGRAARRHAAESGRSVDADSTEILTGLHSLRSEARSGAPEPGSAEVTAITTLTAGGRDPQDPLDPDDLADDDLADEDDFAEPAHRMRRIDRDDETGGLASRLATRPVLATLAVVVVLAVAGIVTALTVSGADPAPAAVVDQAQATSVPAAATLPPSGQATDVDPESDKAVEFLTAMRAADIPTSRSGQAETEAAAVICEQLGRGSAEDTLVRALPAVLPDVTRAQAGDVVDLAQKHYC